MRSKRAAHESGLVQAFRKRDFLSLFPKYEPTPLQSALLNSGVVCQDNLPENNGQTTAWSDSLQVIICADLVQQLHLYTYCIKTN